jgi:hypothetical protein
MFGLIQVLYATMALSFENKEKIDQNKDFPILLLKVSIKPWLVLYPRYWNFGF